MTGQLLHAFLDAPLARDPAAIAIDVPPGRDRPARQMLSYGDFDALATRIAQHLAGLIAGESIVALLIARTSPLFYAAQVAVTRAGGAFTCLDPAFPDDRMGEILVDADPVAVLADAAGLDRLGRLDLAAGLAVDVAALARTAHAAALPGAIAPSQLAYVIYTSGTTGKPKGVQVEHRNIANLVAGDLAEFGLGPADRVVQGSSGAYDSSQEEIWLALASGATLVVMDDAAARLGPDVVGWLRDERITVFCPPPTLLRATGCADPHAALPDLRLLYVGGEALPQDLADLWGAGRRMVNGYGPTECAVVCLRCDVVPGRPVGIGLAVPGMTAWVLDDALEPVADGAQGELCMGGLGVARGYRNRPELTAEKFVDHPRLGRIYRTGDLVDRDVSGTVFYHGRIDAQVKIRGYRVELGEIEARLAAMPGVRAAACRLQPSGAGHELVGFVVADDLPPELDTLRTALARNLPGYMVPVQIGVIADLPTTVGGKLDRAKLPLLMLKSEPGTRAMVAPRGEMETLIMAGVADILRRDQVSVDDDFFADLGGDSLSAALLVTLLRDDRRTHWVTVSDIYEARTTRALAALRHGLVEGGLPPPAELDQPREGTVRPVMANVVQIGWLAVELAVAGWLAGAMAFVVFPLVYGQLGPVGFVALAPVIALASVALYVPLSVIVAVALKRVLIGRYRPIRARVWSGWYLRHWVVVSVARLIPWPLLQGSGLQQAILRALGAKIGRGVHIHRGVDLARGGWDLLDIGDGVSIGQDAMIGLADLDRGDVVIGPIVLEAGATMLTRAGIGGWCRMGADSQLTALSVLNPGMTIPAGELWDGVPARPKGFAPPAPPPVTDGIAHGLWDALAMVCEAGLGFGAALPAQAMALALCLATGVRAADVWRWAWHPTFFTRAGAVVLAVTVLSLPLTLTWTALMMRLMGPVKPGTYSRWSLAYLRAWLKAGMLTLSGEWLTGTIFWPRWLRLAGMQVGRACEISTITDVVPELVTIGAETFFADGIYLGGGIVRHGTVRLGHTVLGRNTFLGNHVVIPPGEVLPDDILIGIATPANAAEIATGKARFGHPAFDLPRREVIEVDRSLTFDPSPIRYANRALWEVARFVLPVLPVVLSAEWFSALAAARGASPLVYALVVIPLITLMPLVALCGAVLVLKWVLIGRVKPGQHALWSCWCSRWDYVFVAWARYAASILRQLEGTFLLPVYLRAMGLKIGRRAVLGPQFAQVVDPDMIHIGDGATVSAMFQAHTFEDRVLKVDCVHIGAGATMARGTVPLYGAVIDDRTHVGANSVVMKREHLLPGLRYQGVPSHVLGEEPV
ncbi:amino acid adenylation domain-containing protein [Novosphingobium sp.]|uniref:non-ribosomal peptide synthetase n=1 Tax=Novosphingobium sp. TaxID=1874826 RepID=UPI003D13A5C0